MFPPLLRWRDQRKATDSGQLACDRISEVSPFSISALSRSSDAMSDAVAYPWFGEAAGQRRVRTNRRPAAAKLAHVKPTNSVEAATRFGISAGHRVGAMIEIL
jgi:hypothetical protein